LEETCLVAKPALPFADLKARLYRRLDALGVKVVEVHDEEWSFIPCGGPLPAKKQAITAFGAAGNLIHPATGYSLTRSLKEADEFAQTVTRELGQMKMEENEGRNTRIGPIAERVWESLWSEEKKKRMAFNVFGMELLTQLDLKLTKEFFLAFFKLPEDQWTKFLSNSLSSAELLLFAMRTFFVASFGIKYSLVKHLLTSKATPYAYGMYFPPQQEQEAPPNDGAQNQEGGR